MPETANGIIIQYFFKRGINALKKALPLIVFLAVTLTVLIFTGWFWVLADKLNIMLGDSYIVNDMILGGVIFVWFILFYNFAKRFKARFSKQEDNVSALFNDLNIRLKKVENDVFRQEKQNK